MKTCILSYVFILDTWKFLTILVLKFECLISVDTCMTEKLLDEWQIV